MWQLYGKILFKVSLLLLILIGALNYMLYLRGTDPIALWKNIGSNMLTSLKASASDGAYSLDELKHKLKNATSSSTQTQIYAWKDADGTMHYSTSKPEGVEVQSHSYDPQANVVQRFTPPAEASPTNNAAASPNNSSLSAASTSSNDGTGLPQGAGGLSGINGIDLENLDKTLKARQEMLDQF